MTNSIKPATVLFLAGLFLACNGNDQQSKEQPSAAPVKTAASFAPTIKSVPSEGQDKPYEGQYCTISRTLRENDTVYIEADYVQFLMGKEAVEAAKKHGEEGMVMDDYYIVNDNTQLRKLPLADNVTIEMVQSDDAKTTYKQDYESLGALLGGNQLFILTIKDGVVQKIKRQYLP